MLRYVSSGARPFGDYPMPPHRRPSWEFYAVIGGQLAPLFDGVPSVPCRDTLWLFPPDCEHGWIGEPGQECQIVVFHFNRVPAELEARAKRCGYLAVPLTANEREWMSRLAAELKHRYRNRTSLSEIYFERALLELSLLILEKPVAPAPAVDAGVLPGAGGGGEPCALVPAFATARVVAAENWFVQHLAEQPSLADLARAGGISAGHLRRLFSLVRRQSAREVLNRIRMERAMHLLAHSNYKVATIAATCGFAGASQFGEAFKKHTGTTPTFWRKHTYADYRHPATVSMSPREVLVQLGLLPRDEEKRAG